MSAENKTAAAWIPPTAGTPCWVEFTSDDTARAQDFYKAIFPAWEFNPRTEGENAGMVSLNLPHNKNMPNLSGGIIKPRDETAKTGACIYFSSDSIDETSDKVKKNGGSVCLNKTQEGEFGWYAKYRDPYGNLFGVFEARQS